MMKFKMKGFHFHESETRGGGKEMKMTQNQKWGAENRRTIS